MTQVINRSYLVNTLRDALFNLYNPYELKHNLLQSVLVDQKADSGGDLKQILVNAINALMPDVHTPYDTKEWKYYELLNYCFIDQVGQKEAAKTLLISLRTLQRLLPEAIEVLAEQLAVDYHLTLVDSAEEPARKQDEPPNTAALDETWVKETDLLKSRNSAAYIDIHKMLREISQILQPISTLNESRVQIKYPEEAWLAMGQVTILRQAVLTAISSFDQQEPGLQITISSERKGSQGEIRIRGQKQNAEFQNLNLSNRADIPAALTNLMNLLNGSAQVLRASSNELSILLTVPAQRQFKIMVVDDNADAIRLVEKYLSSGIYMVTGIQDPERVIPELEKEQPSLILMDVMLPNIDGWMLLSQIRRNPGISRIPVIISTILPQEDLSLSLGADGFLRKPYTQPELLRTLDTHILRTPM
jgi:CheY-like chemotaxis protein